MKFSNAQFAAVEERHAIRVLDESLIEFENDTVSVDPKLANDISTYRRSGNMEIFQRIIALTDVGVYQRALLAMVLQGGIDFTTDERFDYIMGQPALSGNTKARHLILMSAMIQQSRGQWI